MSTSSATDKNADKTLTMPVSFVAASVFGYEAVQPPAPVPPRRTNCVACGGKLPSDSAKKPRKFCLDRLCYNKRKREARVKQPPKVLNGYRTDVTYLFATEGDGSERVIDKEAVKRARIEREKQPKLVNGLRTDVQYPSEKSIRLRHKESERERKMAAKALKAATKQGFKLLGTDLPKQPKIVNGLRTDVTYPFDVPEGDVYQPPEENNAEGKKKRPPKVVNGMRTDVTYPAALSSTPISSAAKAPKKTGTKRKADEIGSTSVAATAAPRSQVNSKKQRKIPVEAPTPATSVPTPETSAPSGNKKKNVKDSRATKQATSKKPTSAPAATTRASRSRSETKHVEVSKRGSKFKA